MDYPIKSGRPVPPPRSQPGVKGVSKYPWAKMEIGQYFEPDLPVKTARSMATRRAKQDGRKYAVRREVEDGVVRIWRTA